jgi:hypothetical protein
MSVYDTLRESVPGRRFCRIYKFDQAKRKVCPYRTGKSSENDLNVLYYQNEGYSSRGLQPEGSSGNSRCNRISDIATAEIADAAWRPPIQKPKTRGNWVVLLDVEVKDYYY